MGTNYYAIPKVSPETKHKIIDAITADDYETAKGLMPNSVHIGKSSAGWKFMFNHNDWEYWDRSLDSLCDFLKKSQIEDEYGQAIDYEEFWKRVKATDSMIDGKEYYTNYGKYNKHFVTGDSLPMPDYVPSNFGEEYHFGLRFSDCTEFS